MKTQNMNHAPMIMEDMDAYRSDMDKLKRSKVNICDAARDFMDSAEIAYQDLTDGQYGKLLDSVSGKRLSKAIKLALEDVEE